MCEMSKRTARKALTQRVHADSANLSQSRPLVRDVSPTGFSPIGSEVPIVSPFKKTCPIDPVRCVGPKGATEIGHLFCRFR
ncbi:hypothetical protein EV673_1481 [Limnobacter thiooxidans]|uniref:Uncharacterized protein n=1 Tax=Limnobacter thiooxidans TaxID=131080 RepID=A0AA86IX04_9BURK|nr:hypothetical protein EV673_1481 [Limnobacter thiooxidans]BET24647.1 hypothetical protein RGQ30_01480 [Limnobacter thiooxidans]